MTPLAAELLRLSRHPCPAECAFNAFNPAHYGTLLELENAVDQKTLERLIQTTLDREAVRLGLELPHDAVSTYAFHNYYVNEIFRRTDKAGLTCAQQWERAGFTGLKNDERVMFQGKMKVRIALFEIRRVLNDYQVEAVDLLAGDGGSILICDRSMAASAVRFAPYLTWAYPLPHYWRMHGSAVVLPEVGEFEPLEVVTEIVRHLGGPTDLDGLRDWLMGNFVRFYDAFDALGRARHLQMFEGLDARFGKAIYEWRRPFAECRDWLNESAFVAEGDLDDAERDEGFVEALDWMGTDPKVATIMPNGGAVLQGRVLLGQAHARVEAMGGERFAKLRQEFERHMQDRVRFVSERVDNLAAELLQKELKFDHALVPPRLLENPRKIHLSSSRIAMPPSGEAQADTLQTLLEQHDHHWLDDPVPALDGKTPREAANLPALRPKLIRLMKGRVRDADQRNLEDGMQLDVNWMLRELGLHEILFDPPPPRPCPPGFQERDEDGLAGPTDPEWDERAEELEDDEDSFDLGLDLEEDVILPPSPPLPERPFTRDEVVSQAQAVIGRYEAEGGYLTGIGSRGAGFFRALDEMTVNLLDDNGYSILVPALTQIWHMFVPFDTWGPVIKPLRLHGAIKREMELVMLALKPEKSAREFETMMRSGPQPALAEVMVTQLIALTESLPRQERPAMEHQAGMAVVLRTAIAELDTACREA